MLIPNFNLGSKKEPGIDFKISRPGTYRFLMSMKDHRAGWAFERNIWVQCYFYRAGEWAFIEAWAFITAFMVYI